MALRTIASCEPRSCSTPPSARFATVAEPSPSPKWPGEAGFARSACYAVFPTKADLLRSLSRRHADRLISGAWQHSMVGDTRDQIRAFSTLVIDWISAEPELYIALDRDLTAQEQLDHGVFDLIAQVTEEHLHAQFPGDQMTRLAPIWSRLAVGGVLMTINWWSASRTMTQDDLIGYIVETFAEGIGEGPGSSPQIAEIRQISPRGADRSEP